MKNANEKRQQIEVNLKISYFTTMGNYIAHIIVNQLSCHVLLVLLSEGR